MPKFNGLLETEELFLFETYVKYLIALYWITIQVTPISNVYGDSWPFMFRPFSLHSAIMTVLDFFILIALNVLCNEKNGPSE